MSSSHVEHLMDIADTVLSSLVQHLRPLRQAYSVLRVRKPQRERLVVSLCRKWEVEGHDDMILSPLRGKQQEPCILQSDGECRPLFQCMQRSDPTLQSSQLVFDLSIFKSDAEFSLNYT